jgi:GT2 family glycosyltransferase
MNKTVDLSIIIVNYNSKNYLNHCLKSIYEETKSVTFEIIVIDNASTDNSLDLAKRNFPQVKIIKNRVNKGFSAANNQGIRASSGKYVLLLNHDTEIKGKALKILLDFMGNNPTAGACGAKLLNSDGTIQHQSKRGFPTPASIFFYATGISRLFPKSKLFGRYLMTYLDSNKTNEVDALSGACILARRQVLDSIGLMDEDFFLYGEDLDLCYRIKRAGWKIYFVPQAQIIHFGGVGSRVRSHKSIIEFHQSMFIYYKKHYKQKYPFLVTGLVYSGIYAKCGLNIFMNAFRKEKFAGSKKP